MCLDQQSGSLGERFVIGLVVPYYGCFLLPNIHFRGVSAPVGRALSTLLLYVDKRHVMEGALVAEQLSISVK